MDDNIKKDTVQVSVKPVMIYPDKELRDRLERHANDESRTMSNAVVAILKEYFKQVDDEK